MRPVSQWNPGKAAEYEDRVEFVSDKIVSDNKEMKNSITKGEELPFLK